MELVILVVNFLFLVSMVSSKVALKNPGFESPPTNLTTNITSFVLLDKNINVIPGWSFNGTVKYVTSGGNISLPGNGHGLQLGPNSKINQTFKSDESYYYVLTFTLAPSSLSCANNSTAVNVSGPGVWKVFFFKESLGKEMWQSYAFSIGSGNGRGILGVKFQSVASSRRNNVTCWPIIDTVLIKGIGPQSIYGDNGFVNNGFEVGPTFLENSSQGILLEANSDNDPHNLFQSPLQEWTILGTVKHIDSKHYTVPQGSKAIELVYGNPSGIVYNSIFLKQRKITIDFIMGDANDSCVGDFVVFLQVGNMMWNFTMRSIGVGSSERHSVTFKTEFGDTESVPISFFSFNETRTTDHQVFCGPVIDGTVIRVSSAVSSKKQHKSAILVFVLVVTFLLLV